MLIWAPADSPEGAERHRGQITAKRFRFGVVQPRRVGQLKRRAGRERAPVSRRISRDRRRSPHRLSQILRERREHDVEADADSLFFASRSRNGVLPGMLEIRASFRPHLSRRPESVFSAAGSSIDRWPDIPLWTRGACKLWCPHPDEFDVVAPAHDLFGCWCILLPAAFRPGRAPSSFDCVSS